MMANDTVTPSRNASLKRILKGETPTVLLYRSSTNARLGEALSELAALHGNSLGVGVVVRIPPHTPRSIKSYLEQHTEVPLLLADPEIHVSPVSGWPRATPLRARAAAHAYLTSVPTKPSRAWVASVVNTQFELGATLPLSASGWVGDVNPKVDLRAAMAFVAESRSVLGDQPMLVNLTMSSRWLSEPALRDILLNEMVESEEIRWYLRFDWPLMKVRYRQLLDDSILRGYRELATSFAVEDRQLYLANSGLSGWLSTAFGATGFSTGQSWSEQKFSPDPVVASRKGTPRPTPVPRILDPKLMHTVDYNEFLRLEGFPNHMDSPTSFSLTMDTDGHAKDLAGLHHVTTVGNLQASLTGGQRSVLALRRVKAAQKFLDELDPVDRPTGADQPQHLPIWRSLLS